MTRLSSDTRFQLQPNQLTAVGRPRASKVANRQATQVTFCVRGVASPLLANIYMNRFLKHWRLTRCGEAFRADVVAYADDFVILSCGYATEALAWTKAVMTKLGLTLNEAKTSVRNARQERFDFLGYCVLQRQRERRGQ